MNFSYDNIKITTNIKSYILENKIYYMSAKDMEFDDTMQIEVLKRKRSNLDLAEIYGDYQFLTPNQVREGIVKLDALIDDLS